MCVFMTGYSYESNVECAADRQSSDRKCWCTVDTDSKTLTFRA